MPGDGFRIDGFSWQGKALPGKTVAIENPFGDIRSRAAEDGHIRLQAIIQKFIPQHDGITFDIEPVEAGLSIRPRLPRGVSLGKGRIDMTLLLPAGTHLDARTTHGGIRISRFRSRARLRSESGSIKIVTPYAVDAHTGEGAVKARFNAREWNAASRLRSDQGSVEVILAEDAQLEITARAGGELVWQDGAASVAELLTYRDGVLHATRGDGGALLEVTGGGDVHFESRLQPRSDDGFITQKEDRRSGAEANQ